MVEPRLGGERAEGEGIIGVIPPPRVAPGGLPEGVSGPRLPEPDFRPGRPVLPEDLEQNRIGLIERADTLDTEIQEGAKLIPGNINRLRAVPTAPGFGPIPNPSQFIGTPIGQAIRRKLFGSEAEAEFTAQVEKITLLREELNTVVWQSGVLNALPVWIEAGVVNKPADIMALTRKGAVATPEEIEFMSDAIMRVQASRAQRSTEAAEFAEILAEGEGSLSALLSINPSSIGSQELVNELVAAGQFQLPVGISVEDARSMLLSIGFTDAQVNEELFDAAAESFRLSQELQAWNARAELIREEGQKIGAGEIVSAIRREQWLRALTQPALAILRPLAWYAEKVAKPNFVTLAQSTQAPAQLGEELGLPEGVIQYPFAWPTQESAEQFTKFVAIAESEGKGSWTAKALAFDAWDANWGHKLAAEIAGDPITLMGFSIYTKMTRGVPFVGPAVRHTERAFVYMGEVPFRGLSTAWRRTVPRTLQQHGQGVGRTVFNLVRTVTAEAKAHVPFRQTDPGDLRGLVTEAIDQGATNPQAMDSLTVMGRALIQHTPYEADDIRALYPSLGITDDSVPITRELVSEFNRAFEKSEGYATTKFFDSDTVSEFIAKRVFGLDDETSKKVIRDALDVRVQEAIRAAKKTVEGGTLREQVLAINDHVVNGFVKAQRASIANARHQTGLVGGMMDGLDVFTRAIWMDKVDKFVTQKFARAYLVFGFYSVANVAEAGAKTIFAGVSPFFRRSRVYDTLGVRAHKLNGLPSNLALPGQGGFDLSLAMPIEQMRTLTRRRQGNQSESKLARLAHRATQRYVTAYNEGRTLSAIGNDLQTAFGYNLGTQITNAQLGNYMNRILYKVLSETAPEVIEGAGRVIDDVTKGFDNVFDERVAEDYRAALFDYLLTGDVDLLDNFTTTFTPGRVHAGEVAKALDQYTELPTDIKDTLAARAEDGSLWGNIDELRDVFEERIFQHYFSSPEMFERSFREVFEGIFESPVRNQAELNTKLDIVKNTLETFDDMVSNTLAAAVTYSRNVHNRAEADSIFQSVWTERIIPNLERVTFGIEDAADELRRSLNSEVFSAMNQTQKDKYNIVIDQMVRKAKIYQNARLEQNEVRTSYFRRNGTRFVAADKRNNSNFWDGYFRDTDQVWERARSAVHGQGGVNQKLLGAAVELDAAIFPPLENFSTRPISRADVARMYGIHPADLERSVYLTDVMAIQGKDNFIDSALMRAQLMARQQGIAAEDFGWTRESIADVYNGITAKLKANPDVNTGIESLTHQLDAAMQDVRSIGFRRNALMDDEKLAIVQSAVDDLQGRIRGKPLAPKLVNEGVQFVPEIRPGTTALPSGEAQAARRNATVRDILTEDRRELESVQEFVADGVTRIKSGPRRDFNAASTRLARMRDRGVDIRRSDSILNVFGDLRDAGQSLPVREARIESWDAFVQSLDTLSIDVEATLENRAVALGKQHLLPGQRGAEEAVIQAPTGSPEFIQNLVDAGLAEDTATRVSGVLQTLGAKGNQFTRRSLAREIGPGANIRGTSIVDELERLNIIVRTQEPGVFRLQGETARSHIVQDVIREEQFVGGPTLEFQRKNLRTFQGANEPPDWALREIFNPDGTWQEVRQAAFDETNARRNLDFPDYENQTALSYVMKAIFPFWGYEAHRWAWYLPREAVRHPGVFGTWGKYIDNTDQGYISIPNLPLDINPLRGTIFMGGFRRLQQRDYPEYYDNFKGLSEYFDYGSRWGFYPGAPVGIFMAGWGAKSGGSQWGEILPALARNAFIDIPGAVAPEAAERLRQVIFPDRFRDFLIANEVSRLDFDKELGINGMELLRKKLLDEEFTEEENAIWFRAARGVATWGLLMEQTGLFRLRPEEKTQVYKDVNQILSEETGVPVAVLEDMRRAGIRYEDVFGGISPEAKRRLNVLEKYQRFAGGSLALLPSEIGKSQALTREFWQTVEKQNTDARQKLLTVEQDFLAGRQTFAQWEGALVEYINDGSNVIGNLKETPRYKDVPVTQEERLTVAEETGIKIFYHPLEELRTLYFEKELEDVYDEDTGQVISDFDGLFLYRDVITQSLPDRDAEEFQAFRRRNDTPLTALRFEVSKTMFRPYKNIRDVVLDSFERDEQILIREFLAKVRLLGGQERAEEIRAMPFGDGDTTIIAEYNSRVRTSRENLRVVDVELDAWLNVFGEAHSFQTPFARIRHDEIVRQLRIGNLGDVLN